MTILIQNSDRVDSARVDLSAAVVLFYLETSQKKHKETHLSCTPTVSQDHITPVLSSPHWLPVHFRMTFRILLFVFKPLNGSVPIFKVEFFSLHSLEIFKVN